MKLGSLKSSSLDGDLVVVSQDLKTWISARDISPSMRLALENWSQVKDPLEALSRDLNEGKVKGSKVKESEFLSPLPRSFQWIDGSTFIQHIKLVRKSRNAALPETLYTEPLVYQGSGDSFLAPREDIPFLDESFGLDFEAEVAVITDDVPQGVSEKKALDHIVLILLCNDVSLRGLAPGELKKGFGFLQSKPSSSFSPFAVTPDELGKAWKEGRVHLPLQVNFNGESFGTASAGEMHFHFGQVISHCAKTRKLTAGTLIGSGTVSNEDKARGSSCLVEKRTIEKIEEGEPRQSFMKPDDKVEIKMEDEEGKNIFGTILQKVSKTKR